MNKVAKAITEAWELVLANQASNSLASLLLDHELLERSGEMVRAIGKLTYAINHTQDDPETVGQLRSMLAYASEQSADFQRRAHVDPDTIRGIQLLNPKRKSKK